MGSSLAIGNDHVTKVETASAALLKRVHIFSTPCRSRCQEGDDTAMEKMRELARGGFREHSSQELVEIKVLDEVLSQ